MLYKQLLIALCLVSACVGMEKTQVSKKNSNITLITKDEERIALPDFCMPLCQHLKDMVEDFSSQSDQNHEIRCEWRGKDVQGMLKLLAIKEGHSAGDFQHELRSYLPEDLAHILALVNFLNCPTIFMDVVLGLAEKIDAIVSFCFLEDSSNLCAQLDEILPRELQKLIQEIILIKHKAIAPLIKATHRIKDPGSLRSMKNSDITWSTSGRFIVVSFFSDTRIGAILDEIILYDLSGALIRKIGEIVTTGCYGLSPADCYGFSLDDNYFFYRGEGVIHLVALQGGQNRSFKIHGEKEAYGFSQDSKAFIIGDVAYCVETGKQLDRDGFELYDRRDRKSNPDDYAQSMTSRIRSQFPGLRLDDKMSHYFSQDYQFIAIKTLENPSLLYLFDIRLPEAIKLCFSGKSDRNVCRVISCGNSVFLSMGFPVPFIGERYDRIIHVDVHAQKNYEISNLIHELSAFAHDRILLLSIFKTVRMYLFISSTSQWVSLDISQNFAPMQTTAHGENPKEGLFFADFDKNYFVVRCDRSGQSFIEMHFIPRDLLVQRCTLKEMMMVINCAKNPSLRSDPHYKSMYDNLDAEVLRFVNKKTIEEEPAVAERPLSQEDADRKAI